MDAAPTRASDSVWLPSIEIGLRWFSTHADTATSASCCHKATATPYLCRFKHGGPV